MITSEQAEYRKDKCGASDSAALMGMVNTRSRTLVFLEKTGKIPGIVTTERMDLGNALEATIANIWSERFGHKIEEAPDTIVHPEHPFIIAHLDRNIVDEPFILEVKNTEFARGWGEPHTDDIPRPVIIQVQHQMGMFTPEECEGAFVVVMIAGSRIQSYFIPRNQRLIDIIYAAVVKFWQEHVTPQIPPTWDTIGDLKLLYPHVKKSAVTATEAIYNDALKGAEAKVKVKEWEVVRNKHLGNVQDYMGTAELLWWEEEVIAAWPEYTKSRKFFLKLKAEV